MLWLDNMLSCVEAEGGVLGLVFVRKVVAEE